MLEGPQTHHLSNENIFVHLLHRLCCASISFFLLLLCDFGSGTHYYHYYKCFYLRIFIRNRLLSLRSVCVMDVNRIIMCTILCEFVSFFWVLRNRAAGEFARLHEYVLILGYTIDFFPLKSYKWTFSDAKRFEHTHAWVSKNLILKFMIWCLNSSGVCIVWNQCINCYGSNGKRTFVPLLLVILR